jgi:hypothetical protein
MPDDDPLLDFYKLMHKALGKFGMDLDMPKKLRPLLEEAGFVNIQCTVKKVPIGPWALDKTLRMAGVFLREAVVDLCAAMTSKAFRAYGMSTVETEMISMSVRKTLKELNRHRYLDFYFWTAQKPE